jgi:predicted AAA+ superfamily ATPase
MEVMTAEYGKSTAFVGRDIEELILRRLDNDDRIILLFGARRVGKTTLVGHILAARNWKCLELTGDDITAVEVLSSREGARLRGLVGGYDLIFIDEAQRIPEIGLGLKLLHDSVPGLRIIATGSSALDLASQTREALTGRTWSFMLHPFSQAELLKAQGGLELARQLERDLVFGSYPEARALPGDADRAAYLRELHASYLFKDILEVGGIRQPRKIVDLLKLLAFQVGSEVSYNELGTNLGMSKDTVASYIDLLEKAFILFRLQAFSRNLRSEVTRSSKIYFHDNGVRNVAIGDFRAFAERPDKGALWENFVLSERRKRLAATSAGVSSYFWRLSTGAEIDYVEESDGRIDGWEIKLSPSAKARPPKSWAEAYPNSSWAKVDRSNYLEFVAGVAAPSIQE